MERTADKYAIKLLFHLSVLFFAACQANATIDVSLQMQLGNPSNAGADTNNHAHYLIQRPVEAMDYNDNLREPNWASWDLMASDVGSSGRSSVFFADTNLPSGFYVVAATDYSGSGYDRGHMCPSGDRTDNITDNDMVFLMLNIIPQSPDNNQGPWENLEIYCRTLAQTNELLIICGPSGFGTNRTDSAGQVYIPSNTWKIIVVVSPGSGTASSRITDSTRVIAVNMPNIAGIRSVAWTNYLTSVSVIQNNTGYTFFTALPANVAAALRAKVDGVPAPPTLSAVVSGAKLIISWPSPASGYSLQQSTDLSTTNWTAFGGTVSSNSMIMSVTNSSPTGNVFYRLFQP